MSNFAVLNQPKVARFLDDQRTGAGFWALDVLASCQRFEIVSPSRMAMFLAMVGHESGWFKTLQENLNYSAEGLMRTWPKRFPTLEIAKLYAHKPEKIANRVYENRMGNGDEASGDGWRYRGRGPLQVTGQDNVEALDRATLRLTGRAHYSVQEQAQGIPLLTHPDRLLESGPGMFWSAWWWAGHKLNQAADAGDILKCTKTINGGTLGLKEREENYRKALSALAA